MKKQIITIAGGGSTYTPGIVQAILNNEKRLPLSEIRLYDIDEERNMDMYLIVKFVLEDWRCEKRTKRFHLNMD